MKREAEQALREIGLEFDFLEEEIWKNGEKVEKDWSGFWKELKKGMKKGYEESVRNKYKEKVMQSQVFVGQEKESYMRLNLNTTS